MTFILQQMNIILQKPSVRCFQLPNRNILFIFFLPTKFFPPISQFRLFSLFHAFVECPHNEKDASTFVSAVSLFFYLAQQSNSFV